MRQDTVEAVITEGIPTILKITLGRKIFREDTTTISTVGFLRLVDITVLVAEVDT